VGRDEPVRKVDLKRALIDAFFWGVVGFLLGFAASEYSDWRIGLVLAVFLCTGVVLHRYYLSWLAPNLERVQGPVGMFLRGWLVSQRFSLTLFLVFYMMVLLFAYLFYVRLFGDLI
jgi:hypothetical protein